MERAYLEYFLSLLCSKSVRFSEEEVAKLKDLSKKYGIGYTSLIREIVRKAIEKLAS